MIMTFCKAVTFDEAEDVFTKCIDSHPMLPIFLVGGGGNGKTMLVNKHYAHLEQAQRVVRRDGGSVLANNHSAVYEVTEMNQVCPTQPSHVIDMSAISFAP